MHRHPWATFDVLIEGSLRAVVDGREYRLPFLAHATMEPMDCVVEVRADACEIWTGSH